MKLFDSHCHLDDRAYKNDLDDVIQRATHAGISAMMIAGITLESCRRALAIVDRYSSVYMAVGIHPHDAKDCSEAVLKSLTDMTVNPKVRAWGEIGLDFNRMFSPKAVQEKWLLRQLEISKPIGLPVIFHERDSEGRLLEILKSEFTPERKGVIHCFSGTESELNSYLDMGLFIGITGILTIKSRGESLRQMVGIIPDDRLLIETDAPYLTPAPEKNKYRRNEPAFVRSVMTRLAQVKHVREEDLAETIWQNTCRFYGISL